VELGGGSALSYRRGFTALPFVPAARRSVTLRGEAFFDVVPGSRPFVVQTFNARVEVLGTRFNVRAWQDGLARETRVTLVEGRVQVAGAQAEAGAVVLARPGQATRVRGAAAQPAAPQQAAMDYVLAWRQGGFAITEAPLAAVFAELERRFGVTIELRDPLAEADSLTLFFPQPEGVEAILDDICTAKGLRYRPSSRGYVVYRP
jgi:transmembrane sensor